MNFRTLFMLLALPALMLLNGCSSPRIGLEVASLPNVNPDSSSRPSPVIVKIYEMRNDLAFRQGDFQTLFMEPMKVLGADLVAADELTFVPGEARTVAYSPMPETRYVGILAAFRQMERARWRAALPVVPEEDNLIRIELNDTSLLVIEADADWSSEERVRSYQERTGKAERPGKAEHPGKTGGEERPEAKPAPAGDGQEATAAPAAESGQEAQPSPRREETSAPGNALPRSRQISDK